MELGQESHGDIELGQYGAVQESQGDIELGQYEAGTRKSQGSIGLGEKEPM